MPDIMCLVGFQMRQLFQPVGKSAQAQEVVMPEDAKKDLTVVGMRWDHSSLRKLCCLEGQSLEEIVLKSVREES